MKSTGDNSVGRFSIEFQVANGGDVIKSIEGTLAEDQIRRFTIRGVVDSGAAWLVLPKPVAEQLGLPPGNKVKVRYADGRTRTRNTSQFAQVEIQGRQGTFTAIIEPSRSDALIGAVVLEGLDLLVDCLHQRLVPRDPRFVIAEIETI